jgi:hypothetical protein
MKRIILIALFVLAQYGLIKFCVFYGEVKAYNEALFSKEMPAYMAVQCASVIHENLLQ